MAINMGATNAGIIAPSTHHCTHSTTPFPQYQPATAIVESLVGMGFDPGLVVAAVRASGNSAAAAAEMLAEGRVAPLKATGGNKKKKKKRTGKPKARRKLNASVGRTGRSRHGKRGKRGTAPRASAGSESSGSLSVGRRGP